MYHHITGVLAVKHPSEVVIEAGGVGYFLRISMNTYAALPAPGGTVRLLTHMLVAETDMSLIGFASSEERDFFRQLHKISGVGASIALAILSGGSVADLRQAIRTGKVQQLKQVKGVGDKMARRIVLELGRILVREEEDKKPKKSAKKSKKSKEATKEEIVEAMPPIGDDSASTATTFSADMPDVSDEIHTAAQTVAVLQEVTEAVAIEAVHRARAELVDENGGKSGDRPNVQVLVRRALRHTE